MKILRRMLTHCKFLHVIARGGAMGQSVTPAVGRGGKQCFGQIRKSAYEFSPGTAYRSLLLRGCGLPHLGDTSCASFTSAFPEEKPGLSCSAASPSPGRTSAPRFPFLHWFAMTCKNMWRGCVCKDVARNDMQRAGACMDVWRGGAQKVETCQRRQGRRAQGHAEDRYVSAPRGGIGAAT